jgi:hypothetical protein
MKFDMLGSAATGFFGVSAVWLAQFGASWPVVALALLGAVLAVLEARMEGERRISGIAVIFGFNALIGVFGSPIAVSFIEQKWGVSHPGTSLIVAGLLGYVGHDVFASLKGVMVSRLALEVTGPKK